MRVKGVVLCVGMAGARDKTVVQPSLRKVRFRSYGMTCAGQDKTRERGLNSDRAAGQNCADAVGRDLSQSLSAWLDVLRLGAALVVVLGHAGNIRFTDGALFWVREWTLAPDAVIVFFVVSGLVVGRAATRDGAWCTYAFHRVTRLISVVLPALLLTLVLDAIGRTIDTSAYRPRYYEEAPILEFLLRGLSFSQQWRGVGPPIQLGSNAPLWSLSFEAAYYILLGVAVFAKGWVRIFTLALLAWIFGLSILLLLPTWLAGLAVWQAIRAGRVPERRLTAVAFGVLPIVALVVAKLARFDEMLLQATPDWLGPVRHTTAFNFGQEVLWNSLIAAALALHLIGMSQIPLPFGRAIIRAIRWWAGASFSIYVVHYPVMHLMDAGLPETLPAKSAVFVCLPVAVALVFAQVFERPLPRFRRMLSSAR